MTDTKKPSERRVVLPVDPSRRTEIDKQRVPMSARPYRLLALVKQDAVVRVQKEPDDTVMTWPHLLSIEFLAAGMMSIFVLFNVRNAVIQCRSSCGRRMNTRRSSRTSVFV